MQGAAPGRMKGLLVSHGNDLYLYGGMPHTAFTSARTLSSTSFAYPEVETIFMRLSPSAGSKWQSMSCEGAVPESRTRIHSGHAGQSVLQVHSAHKETDRNNVWCQWGLSDLFCSLDSDAL